VPEDDVIRLAAQCIEAGADEAGLSDTVGYANPAQVRRLFKRLRAELGTHAGAAHMHNTRGLGIANCLAAWDEGVRTFDASLGGLGGCPYAPGASGNVGDRRPRLHVRGHGRPHRHRHPETDRGARAAAGRPAGRTDLRHDTGSRFAQGLCPGTQRTCPHEANPLPYAGIRVVEFTHMVMGPTCGMLLADLGAEVIKVEPIEGDNTRRLLGSGAGFFPLFNRNKKSIALDLQKPEGREPR
jgi:hypothetical protein